MYYNLFINGQHNLFSYGVINKKNNNCKLQCHRQLIFTGEWKASCSGISLFDPPEWSEKYDGLCILMDFKLPQHWTRPSDDLVTSVVILSQILSTAGLNITTNLPLSSQIASSWMNESKVHDEIFHLKIVLFSANIFKRHRSWILK
jgi:hypothetical protein